MGSQKNPTNFTGENFTPIYSWTPRRVGPALHEVDQVTIPKLIIALDVFTLRFFDELSLDGFFSKRQKTVLCGFLVGERWFRYAFFVGGVLDFWDFLWKDVAFGKFLFESLKMWGFFVVS